MKSTLPKSVIAPEFVESLRETASDLLLAWLENHKAPQSIIKLYKSAEDFGYSAYMEAQGQDDFGMGDVVVELVNSIAEAGGVFHSPVSVSVPRTTPNRK